MTFLTDGTHLYEVACATPNYGRAGGLLLTVRDCVSEELRRLSLLEAAACSMVACDEWKAAA